MKTSERIRVGVVEDHVFLLGLLTSALSQVPDFDVVATASSVKQAKDTFDPKGLDVIVLDVELPDGNGVGLGVTFRRSNAKLGILLLSDREVLDLIFGLPEELQSGWSYLTKSATESTEFFIDAVRKTAQGQTVIDPVLIGDSTPHSSSAVSRLTRRQIDVLQAVARGDSNKAIADSLNLAVNSVSNHLIAIYDALGIPEGKNARVAAALEYLKSTQPNSSHSFSDR